jgi:hypothetical protein
MSELIIYKRINKTSNQISGKKASLAVPQRPRRRNGEWC